MNAQELIIGHLLPIAVTIAVLWLVYRLLFRNSNRLCFNRFFLLTSLLIALAMPLLGLLSGMESQQMVVLKQNLFGGGIMLNEVIVTPDGQPMLPEVTVTTSTTPSRFSVWQVIGGLYLIGVGVMTLLFLFKLGKLVALIIRSPKRKMSGFTAVFTGRDQGSFSFFRYAFFPNENVDPDIMRHEMSHISHHHSWDILFAEVMMILQWFNPFIYLYKKELQSLHEYQADRDVVATGVDKKNYMMLILQQCTAVDFSKMSNNFSLILTKKRIKMITKNEKAKGLWWRLLATLPVLAFLLVANTKLTAQDASNRLSNPADDKPITIELGQFEIFGDDGLPMQLKDTVIYSDDGSYVKFETSDAFQPESGEPCKKVTVTSYDADGTPRNNFFITETERRGDTATYSIEPFTLSESVFESLLDIATSNEDPVYQSVDKMPEFPGGIEALMQYVVIRVKFPREAIENKVSGRVLVGFVIEKDGSVSNVNVVSGLGYGCDEEAVRVVRSMPKWYHGWKDGQPVRVSYNLPIKFDARDLTGDGIADAAMVRMEDEEGHSFHIDRSVDLTVPESTSQDSIFQVVDQMPEFPGGMDALMEFISTSIKYPEDAVDEGKEGRVFVSFVVEKDGSVSNIKVLRGVCKSIDEEASRVVRAMPKWKPGMKDGKPVRVSFQLPITFKLGQTNGEHKTTVKTVIAGDDEHASKTSTATIPDNPKKADMKPDKNGVYQIVEEMPEFPGGVDALMQFLSKNIKYPEKAKDENISGRVFLGFVVEKDGSIGEVKVLRGIGGGCDEEAVRVVKAMPKWKPGKMEGQPVRVSYQIPINFKLDSPTTNGLENTTWEGSGTGTLDGTKYTMSMTMEFESDKAGYFVMTLTANKEGQTAKVFEDVGLPFNYTFDGKSIGSIQPKNPDGSDLGEKPQPPYGFLVNKDGTITVSFYDFKEDIGVEKIVFKKQ